jgi:L-ascorbate metabolism protein UlaG (beta-lactamase superfamily)
LTRRGNNRNRYYQGPESDHFDGRLFFNSDGVAPRGFLDLLRWRLRGGGAKWPASWPSPHPPATPVARIAGEGLRVTMVGHATLLIQVAGLNVLTDPVWSQRMSPVAWAGPRRINAPGIAFDDLPPIDLVLLSHNHYDHFDAATLRRVAAAHDPLLVTALGNDAIVAAAAPGMRVAAHDWGESVSLPGGCVIHVEPAHHWSARGAFDRRMALWAGFVVETPAGKVYFAGDTSFHGGAHYRRLADKHGDVRLAILPIGAYEPRWFMESFHQDPDEAVEGMLLCRAAYAAGCHWGTVGLTDEPVEEPRDRLLSSLDARGVERTRFRPMLAGEVWDVPAG